jgi:tetratricopeptide (TPR) repeat protein
MLGIAEAQLGFIETGIHRLVGAIKADPEDASNFRHQRELSIAYWLDGNFNEALRVISKLWENSPEIKRNALVMAAILVSLGRNQDAEKLISKLKTNSPKLSLSNAYLPCIFDLRKREEFSDCLKKVGL